MWRRMLFVLSHSNSREIAFDFICHKVVPRQEYMGKKIDEIFKIDIEAKLILKHNCF